MVTIPGLLPPPRCHPSMATQMFEGRGHAAIYQKYRFAPGKELQQTILSYLQEKVSGE